MNPGDVPYLDLDSTRSIAQKFVNPRAGAHPVAGVKLQSTERAQRTLRRNSTAAHPTSSRTPAVGSGMADSAYPCRQGLPARLAR